MKIFRLGLTGSIGMGKSTAAAIFRSMGIPVWDADAAVHRAYQKGGAAVPPLAKAFPKVEENGGINRNALRALIENNPSALDQIEAIVHPIVAADRAVFLAECDKPLAVFDIPLLYEKGYDSHLDAVLLVTAPAETQRARVLAREGMTEARFHSLLARQMPDSEKRLRSTHIVETLTIPQTEAYISALIDHLMKKIQDA